MQLVEQLQVRLTADRERFEPLLSFDSVAGGALQRD